MTDEIEPYVGPRPFKSGEEEIFFGRDSEAREFFSLVTAHSALLLYAQSGAGKTSLLNAGLIPLLKGKRNKKDKKDEKDNEKFDVFPTVRLGSITPKEIKPKDIENIFILNTLIGWEDKKTAPSRLNKMTIKEYLAERKHPTDAEGEPKPRVVIFDQFEELFSSYTERWQDREVFFQQIGEALEKNRLLRGVFVIREDYLAHLDPYAHLLPEKLRTRFRLERFRKEAARSAITKPLEDTEWSFTKEAADKLIKDLMKIRIKTDKGTFTENEGEFIEPVQLQVVCRSLWKGLKEEIKEFKIEHVKKLGDVGQALSTFYEDSIKSVAIKTTVKEGLLRNWFEHRLITSAGTRGSVFMGENKTGGMPNTVVAELNDLYLIRGESRGGNRWYELTHDRLIEPIRESNRKWHTEQWVGGTGKTFSAKDVYELLEKRKLVVSRHRTLKKLEETPSLLDKLSQKIGIDKENKSNFDIDWYQACTFFSAEVLDGKIRFEKHLRDESYGHLEYVWLQDVKLLKAYFRWEKKKEFMEEGEEAGNYYEICDEIRDKLINKNIKVPKENFQKVKKYICDEYLVKGKIDKDKIKKLRDLKAYRISEKNDRGEDGNWEQAKKYIKDFYENIVPAVMEDDTESVSKVLKAFQFSESDENHYSIVNSFEAAIAIYFLNPQTIEDCVEDKDNKYLKDIEDIKDII